MKITTFGQEKQKFSPYACNTQYQTRLGMSPYEVVFNQKPQKPTKIKLGTTTDEMVYCNPTETSACNTQPTHTHLENQFNHQKIAKLKKGTYAKWFPDKEKYYNDIPDYHKNSSKQKKVNR